MKKLFQLIRVLIKCGRVSKTESNSSMGDTTTLIYMVVGAGAIAATFFAGKYAAQNAAMLGGVDAVFTTIMTAAAIVAFMFTIMTAINQLYISSDMDVLITLPFSPMQLVTAKLVSTALMPMSICVGLIVPTAIGYTIFAENLSWLFLPSMIIGAVLQALYVVAVAAILLMIIMRAFRFIRSRNIISIISTLFMFALSIAYFATVTGSNELDEQQVVGAFLNISRTVKSISVAFPVTGFTVNAAQGEAINLLIAIGVVIAAGALLSVCARTIYFKAALGMTDANGVRGPVSAQAMKKQTAKLSAKKALSRREIKHIFRTPALITNGYLFSIVVPFVMLIPIIIQIKGSISEYLAANGMEFSLSFAREIMAELNINHAYLLIICSLFTMLMACMGVAFSSLSRYIISREGKDFPVLSTMPVSAVTLVTVKRNVAMCINGISGFLLPALILIAACVTGLLPVWIVLLGILGGFAWLLAYVNICAYFDVKKPNINWDNEADVTKNNIIGIIGFGITFALIIGTTLLMMLEGSGKPWLITLICVVFAVLPYIAAAVSEILLRREAAKLY